MKTTSPFAAPPQPADDNLFLGIVRGFSRFWFTPANPLPLGLIRICTGCVILYIHLVYSLDLLALVGPDGWVDHKTINEWRQKSEFWPMWTDWTGSGAPVEPSFGWSNWSVYYHITDPTAIIVCHIGFLIAMVLFTVGFATRITSVLTWVGVISYIQRTPTTIFGMDTIMNVLTIYLMIGPSGAVLSVDRLIEKWRARKEGREPEPVKPMVTANFALRLMQVHFCIIYMASGLSKLQGPAWWNGNALWGTMANYSFAPMQWKEYTEFLAYLARHRPLWEFIMTGGTYFTLFLEISFPFLIWRPRLRWLMIILSVMLHTGIGLIMGLTTFSLLMMCLLLAFVPTPTLERFVNGISRIFVKPTPEPKTPPHPMLLRA